VFDVTRYIVTAHVRTTTSSEGRPTRLPCGAMGRRERERIRTWAERLVREHGTAVAQLIGVDPPLPPVTIEVDPDGDAGVTGGLTITLSERWFREHPDDAGCVLHELTHAYMR